MYWVCGRVMWLDRIPRYGRTSALIPPSDPDELPTIGPEVWTWMWRGHWGVSLLDGRFNLMWKYLDEYERRNSDAAT